LSEPEYQNIRIIRGNIFDTTDRVIAHGVNCKGVMGAGIAKQVRDIYPEACQAYKAHIASFKLGMIQPIPCKNRIVVNMATQLDYGRDDKTYATTTAIRECLVKLKKWAKSNNIDGISMPMIGCGLGGLSWDDVGAIIDDVFGESPVKITVWRR